MGYNLVFLGNRDRNKILEDISSNFRLISSSYQVIFLTNTKPTDKIETNKKLNYKTIVFESSAKNEEMFETYIQKEGKDSIILFDETAINIDWNDIINMIKKHSNGSSMLIVSKQKDEENFFQKIFFNIKNFFAKIFLGFKIFKGNAEIVLLDKVLVSTIKEIPGRSATLTKINGWSGIEPKYIEIAEQPKQNIKLKYNSNDFISVIIFSFIFLSFIATDIILGVLHISLPFLLIFLFIVLHIGMLSLLLYFLTKTFLKSNMEI